MSHLFPYDSDYSPPAPVLDVRVAAPGKRPKSERVLALVDTGADITLLPLSLLNRINAPFILSHRMRGLFGPSTPVDIYGVTLEIAGHTIKHVRVIALQENAGEPILGRNVLNQLVMRADGPGETLTIESSSP